MATPSHERELRAIETFDSAGNREDVKTTSSMSKHIFEVARRGPKAGGSESSLEL